MNEARGPVFRIYKNRTTRCLLRSMRASPFYLLLIALFFRLTARAEPVRIASLAETVPLQNTIKLLLEHGCRGESVANLRSIIERCQSNVPDLDFKGISRSEEGFYEFQSQQEFAMALPSLRFLPSTNQFNCFDCVIALAGDRMNVTHGANDITGPFLASVNVGTNNQDYIIFPAATARDAFDYGYPPSYQNSTINDFPPSMRDVRIRLTALFSGAYVLPKFTSEQKLREVVLAVIREVWRQQGIKFPSKFEVVLCHDVDLPHSIVFTTHAGLLFKRKGRYSYVEKMSATAPFVRLDFTDRSDLQLWLANRAKGSKYTHHFITINDKRIEQLSPPR